MRSVVYRRSGDPAEVLEVVETAEPGHPGASEILVRVTKFPVHHGDLLGIEAPFPGGASSRDRTRSPRDLLPAPRRVE
jgi:NADPH:quinone reductase-like Zn-dependent oxidoreductase